MPERKPCIFSTIIYFGEENGASLLVHPHTRKTITQTKISSKKWRFYFQCVAWDNWRLGCMWANLSDRPSQVQPDSLRSNQRREKSAATSVWICESHSQQITSLCEWNLKERYQYYEQSQAITPYEAFFYIDIFLVKQVWITYLSINQSIIIHMKKGLSIQLQKPSCRAILCEYACVHTYLNSVIGGSAARHSQSDLPLPSGFWTTSFVRLHVDQSISLEHSIILQLQGLRAVLHAWRVHSKKWSARNPRYVL